MLAYLLDENISYIFAEQLKLKCPKMSVESVYHWMEGFFVDKWMEGFFVDKEDSGLIRSAAHDSLTLITYDLNTIPSFLAELGAEGESHAGVVFIVDSTIRSNDFGGLVKALIAHWKLYNSEKWIDRTAFLEPFTPDTI